MDAEIKPGDEVTWRACFRAKGVGVKTGGWLWQILHGHVVKANRTTLVVLRDDWNTSEKIRRDRVDAIKPIPF